MIHLKLSALGAAAIAAQLIAIPAVSAGTFIRAASTGTAQSNVVQVHYDGYRHKHRHYRYYRDDVVVDAPTTYVETRGRRTWVDAPFTAVRVHPRGVWVRAPFVNIYVPR